MEDLYALLVGIDQYQGREIGIAEMIDAVADDRAHRLSADLGAHVVEAAVRRHRVGRQPDAVALASAPERPEPFSVQECRALLQPTLRIDTPHLARPGASRRVLARCAVMVRIDRSRCGAAWQMGTERKVAHAHWLITGCSTGLGRHLAATVLQRGYNAVVTARNAGTLGDLADAGPSGHLPRAALDVTDQAQVTGGCSTQSTASAAWMCW